MRRFGSKKQCRRLRAQGCTSTPLRSDPKSQRPDPAGRVEMSQRFVFTQHPSPDSPLPRHQSRSRPRQDKQTPCTPPALCQPLRSLCADSVVPQAKTSQRLATPKHCDPRQPPRPAGPTLGSSSIQDEPAP
eukprot:621169-Rhodomonas_salina.2